MVLATAYEKRSAPGNSTCNDSSPKSTSPCTPVCHIYRGPVAMKTVTPRLHRRHANAKVDPLIAVTMRQEGKSLRTIAKELGVSRMAVARAMNYAKITQTPSINLEKSAGN